MREAIGDPGGRIAAKELAAAALKGIATAETRLLALDAGRVAGVLDAGQALTARSFATGCRRWLDDLEGGLGRGVRLVSSAEGGEE